MTRPVPLQFCKQAMAEQQGEVWKRMEGGSDKGITRHLVPAASRDKTKNEEMWARHLVPAASREKTKKSEETWARHLVPTALKDKTKKSEEMWARHLVPAASRDKTKKRGDVGQTSGSYSFKGQDQEK